MTKRCTQCALDKTMDDFPRRRNRRGEWTINPKCRPCRNDTVKAWQLRNPDKVRAYGKKSQQTHAVQIATWKQGWLARTIERRSDQGTAWRKNNPDKVSVIERRYRQSHPEIVKAKRVRRIEKYPSRYRELNTERQNRRRARRKAAYVAPVNRSAIYERDKGICQLCFLPVTWKDKNIDHIVPLARGGTHEPANVQLTHEVCNKRKGAHLESELPELVGWLARRGQFSTGNVRMTLLGPRVLALVQQMMGSASWRIAWPFAELHRQGYPCAWGWNDDPASSAKIQDADIVILHRSAWKPGDEAKALAWRDLLHAGGKALVMECDDDLYSPAITDLQLQPDLKLGKGVEQLEQERAANIFALRLVDGVTCSTPYLAEVCRGLTDRPVVVVPNAIDLPRFRAALVGYQRSTQPLTIGWAGGSRPDRDARDLAVAWGRIARRFPRVGFVVAGHPLGALVEAVPADRLTILPNLPLDIYPRNYAEIDIGCCTLSDVPFSAAKSPIKAMEFAAAGAVVVASPTVYSEVILDGWNGRICESADQWEWNIGHMVQYPTWRAEYNHRLLVDVERDHTLQGNIGRWPAAWAEILADFDARRDREVVAFA